MTMSAGSSSGTTAEINVAPLIDVLLVLLIIFMVLVPVMPRGLEALVPQPPKIAAAEQPEQPIVVQVHTLANGEAGYEVNQHSFRRTELGPELQRLMATRRDKVMFVRGDRDLEFSQVAEVVGLGRAANAEKIGILTPQADAGK